MNPTLRKIPLYTFFFNTVYAQLRAVGSDKRNPDLPEKITPSL